MPLEAQPDESPMPEAQELPQPVVDAPTTVIEDPLRQDIQQLVGAIQTLVSLQQAASGNATTSQPPPERVQAAKPTPRPKPEIGPADHAAAVVQPKRGKSSTHDSQQLIDTWIQAIMDYNEAPDRRHDEKWAITISLLKSVGGSQPRIEKALRERQEIHQHHHKHQIDPEKHNLKHRGKRKITDVITV